MTDKEPRWHWWGTTVRNFMEQRDRAKREFPPFTQAQFTQVALKRSTMGEVIKRGFRYHTNDGLNDYDYFKTQYPFPEWFKHYLEESGLRFRT